jgi:hypothetical protein
MRSSPCKLVSRYLSGAITADDLRRAMAGELGDGYDAAAAERIARIIALLDGYSDRRLSEGELCLALIPHASWAQSPERHVGGVSARPDLNRGALVP